MLILGTDLLRITQQKASRYGYVVLTSCLMTFAVYLPNFCHSRASLFPFCRSSSRKQQRSRSSLLSCTNFEFCSLSLEFCSWTLVSCSRHSLNRFSASILIQSQWNANITSLSTSFHNFEVVFYDDSVSAFLVGWHAYEYLSVCSSVV